MSDEDQCCLPVQPSLDRRSEAEGEEVEVANNVTVVTLSASRDVRSADATHPQSQSTEETSVDHSRKESA